MVDNITRLDKLLNRYIKYLDTNNMNKVNNIYNDFLELKKEIKNNQNELSKKEKSDFKLICAEFRILTEKNAKNQLFYDYVKKNKTLNSNQDYLTESNTISQNTTIEDKDYEIETQLRHIMISY